MNIQLRYTDLGNGIIHLDAEYLQPGIASVYLIIENGECAVIETGTCHTVPFILKTLIEFGLNASSVRYVIPTHVHLDHAGGVGLLMQECPNAQLIVHPFGARHMIDPAKLAAGAKSVYGEEAFQRLYGELLPVDAERIIEAPDNFEIELSNRRLRFYDTPGHAKHHFCVHDLQSNSVFSGDTFGIAYPPVNIGSEPFIFVTTTPVQFDPDALLNSINRLVSIKADAFNLTHFGQIKPSELVIDQLKTSIDAFVSITMDSRDIKENRVEVIDQKIQQYLLNKYHQLGGRKSDKDFLAVVAMDSKLNAQGLDFWLTKQA